ncbi:hypothetical protein BS78_09G059400 [Paspalum vaginatum]|nr:hypothetical protein BS78_09G059400 [Paspalum vaginatum]
MAARTGSRRCHSSTSSTARRTRRPASSAVVAPRRAPSSTNNNGGASQGKARSGDMEVRRKMEELSRLVPIAGGGCGGGDDEVDDLLLRAAGYIARLQAQVTVMQLMVDVLEHTED